MHLCNDVWWCWNTVSVWLMMDIDCWIRFICNQNQQMVPVHESVLASNWGRKHPLRVTSCLEKTERNKTKQRIPPQGVWQKSCFFFATSMFFIHTPLFSKIAPIWCQPFIDFMAHPSGAFPGWLVATSVLQKLQQRSIETGLEISSWYVFSLKVVHSANWNDGQHVWEIFVQVVTCI